MVEVAREPALPARYIARFLDMTEGLGIDRGALLREARVRHIDAPGARVTLRQVERIFAAAEESSRRTDLGFELGRRLDPASHDMLGFAMITSPTLGDLLRLAVTYQRLMQPFFALNMKRSARKVELAYVPVVAMSYRAMRVLQEAIVVSNHEGFRSIRGDRMPPYDVAMSMERPTHAPRYAGIAPARVSFGDPVPGLRISLPAAALDLPLAMANPRAARAAEERCRAQLNQARSRRRWSDWCAMMLRESEDCRPTLGELAGIMNVCPRTLSRYLETEGTSFRSLSLKVRTARARQLLREGALSVTQIAYRLGYADVASFVRSFRAQCGRTPGAWRSRHVVAHGKFSLRRKEQRPAG